MNEVICPHCGKANSATDRFCHQCLKPLHQSQGGKENESREEEVPDWLKRIRELKHIDEEREKEKDKWRQQTLFGQTADANKSKDAPTEKKPASPQAGSEKKQPSFKQPLPLHTKTGVIPDSSAASSQAAAHTEKEDDKPLPEGFLPLSIDDD